MLDPSTHHTGPVIEPSPPQQLNHCSQILSPLSQSELLLNVQKERSNIDGVPSRPDIVHNVQYLSYFIPVVVLYEYYAHLIDEKTEA